MIMLWRLCEFSRIICMHRYTCILHEYKRVCTQMLCVIHTICVYAYDMCNSYYTRDIHVSTILTYMHIPIFTRIIGIWNNIQCNKCWYTDACMLRVN